MAGHADCGVTFATDKDGKIDVLKAFPEGEERRAINAVFDEIVADLKLQHILSHQEVIQPLAARPLAENEQISLFNGERPSVMGQLTAAKQPGEKEKAKQTVSQKPHELEM